MITIMEFKSPNYWQIYDCPKLLRFLLNCQNCAFKIWNKKITANLHVSKNTFLDVWKHKSLFLVGDTKYPPPKMKKTFLVSFSFFAVFMSIKAHISIFTLKKICSYVATKLLRNFVSRVVCPGYRISCAKVKMLKSEIV